MVSRRNRWRPVLDAESERWSTKSYDQLKTELAEEQVYEVQFEGKSYTVEVILLENTEQYLHVMIAVDDGSIPASFCPLTSSFICRKPETCGSKSEN